MGWPISLSNVVIDCPSLPRRSSVTDDALLGPQALLANQCWSALKIASALVKVWGTIKLTGNSTEYACSNCETNLSIDRESRSPDDKSSVCTSKIGQFGIARRTSSTTLLTDIDFFMWLDTMSSGWTSLRRPRNHRVSKSNFANQTSASASCCSMRSKLITGTRAPCCTRLEATYANCETIFQGLAMRSA